MASANGEHDTLLGSSSNHNGTDAGPSTSKYTVAYPSPPPSNKFSSLIQSQKIATVDRYELECGEVLHDVQVAYKTWGRLNEQKDNCMVICHALTGSADVEDWWGPMMGRELAFDPSRYFIFCANVLGSPYGSSSPVTINPDTGRQWGPEFPLATIRDDVQLHKIILDHLGVQSIAVVIGGSMGGMQVLEWSVLFSPNYVRNIIPMATSIHHSAWGISWGEAQRQAIYSDPNYDEGYYYEDGKVPTSGLAAARMAALLTYRSRDSFESRFGRREMESPRMQTPELNGGGAGVAGRSSTPGDKAREAHNDGYRAAPSTRRTGSSSSLANDIAAMAAASTTSTGAERRPLIYSAQSYLRYQGDKFVGRFDANCYIAITRKMDSHDLCRGRVDPNNPSSHPLEKAPKGALVLAISSDALFTLDEQREIATRIPEAKLVIIESPEGHDGFLLEFEQINQHIVEHLHARLPEIYAAPPLLDEDVVEPVEDVADKFAVKKDSMFGEAEADVTAW